MERKTTQKMPYMAPEGELFVVTMERCILSEVSQLRSAEQDDYEVF